MKVRICHRHINPVGSKEGVFSLEKAYPPPMGFADICADVLARGVFDHDRMLWFPPVSIVWIEELP